MLFGRRVADLSLEGGAVAHAFASGQAATASLATAHLTSGDHVVVSRGSYEEFNRLLQDGKLDIAFVCGGPYVDGKDEFGLEMLVMPETLSGETVYYSYLIVPAQSQARSLEDLRGKRFVDFDDVQIAHGQSGLVQCL